MARKDSFHDEIYTDPRTGMQYRVDYYADHGYTPPHENEDGHGVVVELDYAHDDEGEIETRREWGSLTEEAAMRMAAYRELHHDRTGYVYYDVIASINKAIREWGCKPEDAPAAVESDYEYLRGWYQDDWHYMTIQVTKLDEDGEETDDYQIVGGYESLMLEPENRADLNTILRDMAHEVEWAIRKRLHEGQQELSFA